MLNGQTVGARRVHPGTYRDKQELLEVGHCGTVFLDEIDDAMQRLMDDAWRGNVRELRNLLERRIARRHGDAIDFCDLPREICGATSTTPHRPVSAVNHGNALYAHVVNRRETFGTGRGAVGGSVRVSRSIAS